MKLTSAQFCLTIFYFSVQLHIGDFFLFDSKNFFSSRVNHAITSTNHNYYQDPFKSHHTLLPLPSMTLDDPTPSSLSQRPNDVTLLTLDGYSFNVLSEADSSAAAELVAQAHFLPHSPPSSFARLSSLFVPFYHLWNQFLLINLTNKIKAGFHYRAKNRLQHPHIDRTEDSIIIIVKCLMTNELIGIVEAYPTNPSYVCNLSVSSKYRRKGIGKLLCQICEDFLSIQWNIHSIYLHVDQRNDAARRLYESLDYQISDNPIVYKTEQNLYFPKRVYVEYVKRLPITIPSDENIVTAPTSSSSISSMTSGKLAASSLTTSINTELKLNL